MLIEYDINYTLIFLLTFFINFLRCFLIWEHRIYSPKTGAAANFPYQGHIYFLLYEIITENSLLKEFLQFCIDGSMFLDSHTLKCSNT
jgi:hypothetical protein